MHGWVHGVSHGACTGGGTKRAWRVHGRCVGGAWEVRARCVGGAWVEHGVLGRLVVTEGHGGQRKSGLHVGVHVRCMPAQEQDGWGWLHSGGEGC